MAKVFISYSRKDIEFAKQLTAELQKSDLDFWIDWEGNMQAGDRTCRQEWKAAHSARRPRYP
jgi:hypothetical protein